MHKCPECSKDCNWLDGETDVEDCAHIMTPDCSGGDDVAADDAAGHS